MNLGRLSLGYKLTITLFVISTLIALLFEQVNMKYAIENRDGEPGVSLFDVRNFFYGDRSQSVLEIALESSSHQSYLTLDEREMLASWIESGAAREGYTASAGAIFDERCIRCHTTGGRRADSPLTSFEEVQRWIVARDSGVPYPRLARMSREYVLSTTCLLALLCGLFYLTRYERAWKQILIVAPLAAMLINVLSWWSAKQSETFVHTIVGSTIVGAASVILISLMILIDVWILPDRD